MMGFHFKFDTKDARALLIALIFMSAILALAYMLDSRIELFDFDGEATLPAWFSSAQLFLIGILFLFSGSWPRIDQIAAPKFMLFIGLCFMFLSIDEAATVHEKIGGNLRRLKSTTMFEESHGLWIPIYLGFAAVIALIGFRSILSFFKTYSRQAMIMSLGAMIFLIGAVGLETVANLSLRGQETTSAYKTLVALEEFGEMIGASIILYGTILCALSTPSKE